MNKLTVSLLLVFAALASTAYAGQFKISGCVIDEKNDPIEYATVVLLNGKKQMGGTTTDDGGCFSTAIEQGVYEMRISYVGLNPYVDTLKVNKNIDLGKIILSKSSVVMKEVTVTASTIRREADRFVMQLEGQPITLGKTAEEILKEAPGVWITDDKISINGNSGTKIYINDREQNMSVTQLLNFLRSISAEDISKIEVLPRAGAEYSADSQAGIIKITLKKNKDNGTMGSVGLHAEAGKNRISYTPHANLNYKSGPLSINASGWVYSRPINKSEMTENTNYTQSNSTLSANSLQKENGETYGGMILGGIYDLNPKDAIGLEAQYSLSHDPSELETISNMISPNSTVTNISQFNNKNKGHDWNIKANFVHKLDTVGSTLKFMATYTYDTQHGNSDNYTKTFMGNITNDSTYRADTRSRYNVFNVSSDFDKRLSGKWNLKIGAKYTLNDMYNFSYYDYNKNNTWIPSAYSNYDIKYDENIYAAYAIANYNHARWQLKGGLRAEYTAIYSRDGQIDKKYLDLFPNANINYLLTEKGDYSIGLGYSRTVERPSFWALSPIRHQISDYSYQEGNPLLKASSNNSLDLTISMAYKYSISTGFYNKDNGIGQTIITDPNDPRYAVLTNDNQSNVRGFYASGYAPVQITKWLSATANVTYVYQAEKDKKTDTEYRNNHMLFANGSINVTFPHNFFVEVNGSFMKKTRFNNLEVNNQVYLGANVKKTFNDNKWVMTLGVNNILGTSTQVRGLADTFIRDLKVKEYAMPRFTLTYNFNSGKKFNARTVESNEDPSRLQKSK